jgi:ribonuclease HII
MKVKYVVGIDEAGKGPLAGPVSVGVMVIPVKSLKKYKNIKNSKQLSEKKREEWYSSLKKARQDREINWGVSTVGHMFIDREGISKAIKVGIRRSLKKLNLNPGNCKVLLDGGLYAPEEFIFQKTYIKGDERIPIIALASIVAKVYRDRKMKKLSKLYPKYSFNIHKGYGTLLHRNLIKKHGPSPIHRMTFLTRIVASTS